MNMTLTEKMAIAFAVCMIVAMIALIFKCITNAPTPSYCFSFS